jgi:hypothetical protein
MRDQERQANGEGILVVEFSRITIIAAGRAVEGLDRNEQCRRRVLDLCAQTTGGGKTGADGKVDVTTRPGKYRTIA